MFGKKSTTKMSVAKRIKQEKHKEKTPEEIQNIIRSRKMAKEKGISKKDLRNMRLKKSRVRLEKKKEKSTKTTSYEESIEIMTFGNVIDSYTKKILDDYHNDTPYCLMNSWKWQEQQRMTRLEMIAQQFDEYEETSPYYNSYRGNDEENFREVEDNEYSYNGCDCEDWMLHGDNQSK
tara:strand:+ start:141 stop:671 length:531 start_codon:yes stop_codon:yes gene_type:complete